MNSVPARNDLNIENVFRFTAEAIDVAPNEPGVFVFYDETGEAILIGSTLKSIRAVLTGHWKGVEGRETCGAVYVGFEQHSVPLDREAELMARHRLIFGRLPRRNTA